MTTSISADDELMPLGPVEDGLGARLDRLAGQFASLFAGFDPATVSGADAGVLVEKLTCFGQRVAAQRSLLAGRVAEAGSWRRDGARSPEDWLARQSGTTASKARQELDTAKRVAGGPEPLRSAYTAGQLSAEAASEVSAATSVAPDAAGELINKARTEDLSTLRRQCRQTRNAGLTAQEQEARAVRLHQQRYLRTWTDGEGAGRIDGRLAPAAYATFLAALAPFRREIFDQARREGRREHSEAYSADAFVAMAQTAGEAPAGPADADRSPSGGVAGKPSCAPIPHDVGDASDATVRQKQQSWERKAPAQVIVLVDHAALIRGFTGEGETCWIEGVGAVPVSTVKAMMADAYLSVVVKDPTDIRKVIHLGRDPTAKQRTALIARDRECVVPGCGIRHGLEIDHVTGWEKTHQTRLDQLARLCHHHHFLKTYRGFQLLGEPGSWSFHPPNTGPDPPGNRTAVASGSGSGSGAGGGDADAGAGCDSSQGDRSPPGGRPRPSDGLAGPSGTPQSLF